MVLYFSAIGDPLGGCCLTPYGYSVMMKKVSAYESCLPYFFIYVSSCLYKCKFDLDLSKFYALTKKNSLLEVSHDISCTRWLTGYEASNED